MSDATHESPAPTPAATTAPAVTTTPTTPAAPTANAEPPTAPVPAPAPAAQSAVAIPVPIPMPVPVPVPLFSKRWPRPTAPAAPAVLSYAAVCGVVAAATVPLVRTGIGWLGPVVAGAAALAHLGRGRSWAARPVADRIERVGWAAATVALVAVGAFRAAGWLYVLCLLTAAVTASLAIAGGRGVRGLLAGAFTWPTAALRAPRWVMAGVRQQRHGRTPGSAVRIAVVTAVAALLVLVFGSLFASADPAFGQLTERFVPEINAGTLARWVFLFFVGALGLAGGAFVLTAPPDLSGLESPAVRRLRRVDWVVPVAALIGLFAVFVGVQLAVLFGGSRHVLRTAGLTYAEYARGGFGQLLVVTALTLAVLGATARWAPRATVRDRVLIRVLLGALAVLTLVIVASALYRMHVYEQAYGFTRLRVLVSLFELWLGLVFVAILVAGVRLRATWLPTAALAVGAAALIGLAVLNPDRFIAEQNIRRYADTGRIDTAYLSTLSPDAVPALDRLAGDPRQCALGPIAHDLFEPDDWRSVNVGRWQARAILAERPAGPPGGCP